PAVVLVVLGQIEVWTTSVDVHPRLLVAVLTLCMTVPLFWRRRYPIATTVIELSAMAVLSIGWSLLDNFNTPMATLLVTTYSGAAYQGMRGAAVIVGLIAAFLTIGVIIDGQPVGDLV